MISYLYNTIIFNPLYNGLIYLFDAIPWIDAGIAVIIFTIIVRLILFPLSKKSIVTQVRMKEIEPELNRLKQNEPDKQKQALAVMALYKAKGVNPFASFFFLFLQLPIIYTLYSIFIRSGLPAVKTDLLYHFVASPHINMTFLGLVDVGQKSVILSLVAAASQFLQLHYSIASQKAPVQDNAKPSAVDAAQNMTRTMKYIFPVIIFFISYKISAIVALYWAVSSLFTLGQELVVRKHLKNHQPL